jgi:hypothetical protein
VAAAANLLDGWLLQASIHLKIISQLQALLPYANLSAEGSCPLVWIMLRCIQVMHVASALANLGRFILVCHSRIQNSAAGADRKLSRSGYDITPLTMEERNKIAKELPGTTRSPPCAVTPRPLILTPSSQTRTPLIELWSCLAYCILLGLGFRVAKQG